VTPCAHREVRRVVHPVIAQPSEDPAGHFSGGQHPRPMRGGLGAFDPLAVIIGRVRGVVSSDAGRGLDLIGAARGVAGAGPRRGPAPARPRLLWRPGQASEMGDPVVIGEVRNVPDFGQDTGGDVLSRVVRQEDSFGGMTGTPAGHPSGVGPRRPAYQTVGLQEQVARRVVREARQRADPVMAMPGRAPFLSPRKAAKSVGLNESHTRRRRNCWNSDCCGPGVSDTYGGA
jgi:hypothetical protein